MSVLRRLIALICSRIPVPLESFQFGRISASMQMWYLPIHNKLQCLFTILIRLDAEIDIGTTILTLAAQWARRAALGEAFFFEAHLLRRALHPKFEGHSGDEYCALQQEGLKMMTTFAWDAEKGEATFWMDCIIMEEMKRSEEWHVGMWLTDTWGNISWPLPVGMQGVIRKGSRWFGRYRSQTHLRFVDRSWETVPS